MPSIRQSLSFLTINNRNLDRNFDFKILRSANCLFVTAKVRIKKNYFKANQIKVSKEDNIYISIQNNNEEKVLVFSGKVRNIVESSGYIIVEAEYRVVLNGVYNETYKDTKLEEVLKMLVPKLKYEASDAEQRQIVCQGCKESTVRRLLTGKFYFIDKTNTLVVQNKATPTKKSYVLDGVSRGMDIGKYKFIAVPKIDINDTVELNKEKILVRGINYDYMNRYLMILKGKTYEEEPYTPPQIRETPEQPVSKPVKPLFVPSEKQVAEGETAQSLLNQLNSNAKTHLETLADQVRIEMGDSFESIVITGVWRSRLSQKNILLGKLDKKINADGSKTKNMYEYYQNTGISGKYLKIIQYLYDGIYTEVPENDYLAIDDRAKRDVFIKIINEFGIRKQNREDVEEVLEESFMKKKLFNPSYHVSDTEKKDARAIDLRTSKESELLQDKHNMERQAILTESEGKIDIGRAYNGSGIGDPHIHVTYRL